MVTLTDDQYEALLDFAYQRRTDLADLRDLQRVLDAANSIQRYFLYVRWMETGGAPPTRIEVGQGWPPTQQFELRTNRPITAQDVQDVLTTQARNPVYVTVTPDERGNVGWTELALWDFDTAP